MKIFLVVIVSVLATATPIAAAISALGESADEYRLDLSDVANYPICNVI